MQTNFTGKSAQWTGLTQHRGPLLYNAIQESRKQDAHGQRCSADLSRSGQLPQSQFTRDMCPYPISTLVQTVKTLGGCGGGGAVSPVRVAPTQTVEPDCQYLYLHYLPLLHKNPEDRRWGNPA